MIIEKKITIISGYKIIDIIWKKINKAKLTFEISFLL